MLNFRASHWSSLWQKIWLGVICWVLVACATQPTAAPKPTIKLVQNPWSASRINVAIAKLILEEKMGYKVEVTEIDQYKQWPEIASGNLHVSLEIWPSGHPDEIKQYMETKKVEDGGALGVVGKVGWYVPTYVIVSHPELATWEGFKDAQAAALFKTAESGTQGLFLNGDPTWGTYDADIVKNLNLNFKVEFVGSEEALIKRVDEAYAQQQPVLFYFWTPHSLHAKYSLSEVALPAYNDACYAKADAHGVDCDYPPDKLYKIFWPGLQTYAPEAYQFLKNFHYDNNTQIRLLAAVDLDKKSVGQVAREWVDQSEFVWKAWVPAQ